MNSDLTNEQLEIINSLSKEDWELIQLAVDHFEYCSNTHVATDMKILANVIRQM